MHRQGLRRLHSLGRHLRHGLRAALVCLLTLLGGQGLWGQMTESTYGLPTQLSGAAQVSFLAAEPHAAEVYTLYGHAGLRVQDPTQGIDVTFNYGLFDFSDDFLWRFIQGKTDYLVAPIATADYFAEYLQRGAVHEVTFATDSLQRAHLWRELLENIQPARRVYRYDAFRNNCSTRPLDLVFEALRPAGSPSSAPDTLALQQEDEAVRHVLQPKSWRETINRLEASSPWLVLGTDLAMGTQLDAPLSLRERFFIPTDATTLLPHLRYGLKSQPAHEWVAPVARVAVHGLHQPISAETPVWRHPLFLFSLLFGISACWVLVRWRGKRLPYLLEGITFTAAGLAGSLLFFLVFISEHPMITMNWNLLVLHPGYLLLPLLAIFGKRTRTLRYGLYLANGLALLAFPLVAHLAGQGINASLYPIALSLLVLQLGLVKAYLSSRHHAPKED